MGNPAGDGAVTNFPNGIGTFHLSTNISGTIQFDTASGKGSIEMDSFIFSGNTSNLTPGLNKLTAIGDGMGGTGTLILASMDFNWDPGVNIPVYVIGDASGFFGTSGSGASTDLSVGDVITGVGATSSTIGSLGRWEPHAPLILSDPMPFAMTTFDAQQNAAGRLTCIPCHPDGTPLGCNISDDDISGVPMATAPFPGHNTNFDIYKMEVTSIILTIPVPAAVWLFISGLLGFFGIASYHKKSAVRITLS